MSELLDYLEAVVEPLAAELNQYARDVAYCADLNLEINFGASALAHRSVEGNTELIIEGLL